MLYNTPICYSFKRTSVLILLMCCVICHTHSIAQKFEKKGNIVTYRGNTFELSEPVYDSTGVVDPVDGKEYIKLANKRTIPVKMNGQKIFRTNEVVAIPVTYSEFGPLGDYIFRELREELNKLPDGNYFMMVDNIVIDDIGKIVYYEYHGIWSDSPNKKLSVLQEKPIVKKLDELMIKAAPFRPGQVISHRNVVVRIDITFDKYTAKVKDHKTTIVKE